MRNTDGENRINHRQEELIILKLKRHKNNFEEGNKTGKDLEAFKYKTRHAANFQV